MLVIKKYGNRRLYDTESSRYITLDELADVIRNGRDVQVLDAKTNTDLTQVTLAQIILESRKAASLLPVPLLTHLIRMGDDALSEFFGKYLSWALGTYLQARQGFTGFNPFSMIGGPLEAFGRMFPSAPRGATAARTHDEAPPNRTDEVAELRREVEALREAVGRRKRT